MGSTPPVGGVAAALAAVCRPVTVVGISSDILYPLAEQRELVALLPNAILFHKVLMFVSPPFHPWTTLLGV